MPENAESHMVNLTANRICVIEIRNESSQHWLCNPKVHMVSGYSFSPPTPTLGISKTEVCSFTKDDNTASGAVGVLTYELFHRQYRKSSEMMAIMFSVPYDYNIYKNWLGLGIFEKSVATDYDLYDKMYTQTDCHFVRYEANGSGLAFKGANLELRACMSDESRAIVKLEVFDKMGR